jgi:hypothetical protein
MVTCQETSAPLTKETPNVFGAIPATSGRQPVPLSKAAIDRIPKTARVQNRDTIPRDGIAFCRARVHGHSDKSHIECSVASGFMFWVPGIAARAHIPRTAKALLPS